MILTSFQSHVITEVLKDSKQSSAHVVSQMLRLNSYDLSKLTPHDRRLLHEILEAEKIGTDSNRLVVLLEVLNMISSLRITLGEEAYPPFPKSF